MVLVRTRSSCRTSPSAPRTHTELHLSPRSIPITSPVSRCHSSLLLPFFMPVSFSCTLSSAPLVGSLPHPARRPAFSSHLGYARGWTRLAVFLFDGGEGFVRAEGLVGAGVAADT